MKNFPIPPITDANQLIVKQIEMQVDKILDAKHTDPDADTSDHENEIDNLVYELYNLTEMRLRLWRGASESRYGRQVYVGKVDSLLQYSQHLIGI